MSDFNKIIKEKVDQFEVPYNDAHWAEMEGKLNSIRSAKIKRNVFSAAAVITIVSAIAYFIIPNNNVLNKKDVLVNTTVTEEISQNKSSSNKITHPIEKIVVNENGETINVEKNVVKAEIINDESLTTTNTNSTDDNSTTTSSNNNTIEFNEKIIVNSDFIVYNNKVCLGEAVSFEAMENDRPVSYLWNFGDGTISHKTNPNHVYQNDGIYSITLTLIDKQSGTEHTSIQEDVVSILAKPSVEFTYLEESKKNNDNVLKYPYTKFYLKSVEKGNTYSWDFGNGNIIKSSQAKTIYKEIGKQKVSVTVENDNGCISKVTKNVIIKNNATLYVQNSFTPNQDGDNDSFMPKALVLNDVQFEMTIFNKTGKTIYKTSDKYEPWTGKENNSGALLEAGYYFWQIVIYDAEGSQHNHQGKIYLKK